MQELTILISDAELAALRAKALKELYTDNVDILPLIARQAMIAGLYTGDFLTFENVWEAVRKEKHRLPPPPPPPPPTPVQKAVAAAKALNSPKAQRALVVPQKMRSGRLNNSWIVWSAIVEMQMSQSTWARFHTSDVQTFIRMDKGQSLDIKVTNAALQTMVNGAWLSKAKAEDTGKPMGKNVYYFTRVAERWLMTPRNQADLIREGIMQHEVKQIFNGDRFTVEPPREEATVEARELAVVEVAA